MLISSCAESHKCARHRKKLHVCKQWGARLCQGRERCTPYIARPLQRQHVVGRRRRAAGMVEDLSRTAGRFAWRATGRECEYERAGRLGRELGRLGCSDGGGGCEGEPTVGRWRARAGVEGVGVERRRRVGSVTNRERARLKRRCIVSVVHVSFGPSAGFVVYIGRRCVCGKGLVCSIRVSRPKEYFRIVTFQLSTSRLPT